MKILRNKSFAILFGGQIVSTLGTNLYLLALPWYVYIVTGSKADLAIVGFAQSLPGLAGLVAGVFVDRWNKRRTMIVADLMRGALSLLIGLIAIWRLSFLWIVVIVLLLQLVGVFFGPAESVLLPLVVREENVPAAMGINQSGSATAQLAGQAGGGALLSALGAPVLFLANGISFFVSVVSLLFVRAPEPPRGGEPSNFLTDWKEGFAILGRSRMILLIVASALVANFGLAAFDIALTAWIRGPLRDSALWLGFIGAAFFVGIIVGGMLLGTVAKKVPLRAVVMSGLIIDGALISSVGAVRTNWWAIAILVLTGLAVGIMNGSIGAMAVQVVPDPLRGRVFGLLGTLSTMATPLGLAVYGALMVVVPLPVLFILMGVVSVLAGLAFLLPIRDDLNNMGTAEPSPPVAQ
ncbi:MFS transporter [Sulfoacidibacillus ferrooxidans]|uniref:MFS transporter n=1 Tax=Sulfoacidibacillus ferrooxidans TaxID=2005001 RepID=UPI001F504846|nr:MFS transporter [Sulfoacidibacillus ferrooxidans]